MEFIDDDSPAPRRKSAEKKEKKMTVPSGVIPPGYIPIHLSSNGRFGVPETIHVRNFTTEFLIELGMASKEILPNRLISALQSLIWEKNTSVAMWPEKLVIELLIKIYTSFFTPILAGVNFPVLEEDLEALEKNGQTQLVEDLQSGKYQPKIDLDLRLFTVLELAPEIKDYVVFSKKSGDFTVKFLTYTKLEDSLLIKREVEEKFGAQSRKYNRLKQTIDLRSSLIEQGKYENLPLVDPAELEEWQLFEAEKALYSLEIARAMNLVEVNGKDVSQMSLAQKAQLVKEDPRFDDTLTKTIDKHTESIMFGLDPVVELKNPLTGAACKRAFTFRYVDILQAVRLSNADEYDISYDNGNL